MDSDIEPEVFECDICSQIFYSKNEFIAHHIKGNGFGCCSCDATFKTTKQLTEHQETHKIEHVVIESDVQFGEYTEQAEAVLNIPNDSSIGSTSELLYILDDSQCVNEVVIEDTDNAQRQQGASAAKANKKDNVAFVGIVDHGYTMPSVFKGQLTSKRKVVRKREVQESDSDDQDSNNLLVRVQPSTSKKAISSPKARAPQPKRMHEFPDFSAPSYVILNPNEDVDIPHYKCLRCEQLFINKFVFFRHIEKGKCYVNSCDVCPAIFEKNSDFYGHYMVEHTDRAICNFCFRTFMYEKNVKEHMLRHLDQFRHRCTDCNKGFYTVREYRNHYKNRHMGIRHKCDECGRSFADEYYFKKHIATHSKRTVEAQTS